MYEVSMREDLADTNKADKYASIAVGLAMVADALAGVADAIGKLDGLQDLSESIQKGFTELADSLPLPDQEMNVLIRIDGDTCALPVTLPVTPP
jgi:hypothetical protein